MSIAISLCVIWVLFRFSSCFKHLPFHFQTKPSFLCAVANAGCPFLSMQKDFIYNWELKIILECGGLLTGSEINWPDDLSKPPPGIPRKNTAWNLTEARLITFSMPLCPLTLALMGSTLLQWRFLLPLPQVIVFYSLSFLQSILLYLWGLKETLKKYLVDR